MNRSLMEQVRNTDGRTVDVVSRNQWDATWGSTMRWFLYIGFGLLVSGGAAYARVTDQVRANTLTAAAADSGFVRVLVAVQALQTQLDSMRIEMRHLTPRNER